MNGKECKRRKKGHLKYSPHFLGSWRLPVLFLSLLFLTVVATSGQAQDWRRTDQATVAWDPVTTLVTGDPIPTTDTVKYEVWRVREALKDDPNAPIYIEETDQAQYTITFTEEGKWFVGIVSVRYVNGVDRVRGETISWSWDVAVAPSPFGIVYYVGPAGVMNVR